MSIFVPNAETRNSLITFILEQRGTFSPAHITSKASKRGIRVPLSFVTDLLTRLQSIGLVESRNTYFTVVR